MNLKLSELYSGISLSKKRTIQSDYETNSLQLQFQALYSKSKHFSNLENNTFQVFSRISSTCKNPFLKCPTCYLNCCASSPGLGIYLVGSNFLGALGKLDSWIPIDPHSSLHFMCIKVNKYQ